MAMEAATGDSTGGSSSNGSMMTATMVAVMANFEAMVAAMGDDHSDA